MTSPAQPRPVHGWARWYWPAALVAALAAFFIPYLSGRGSTGAGLLTGAVLLGGPELACVLTGNFQDTFSDWEWHVTGITDSVGAAPLRRWTARHFLLMIVYLVIVGCVSQWLWSRGFSHMNLAENLVGIGGSIWLLFHFFRHMWT